MRQGPHPFRFFLLILPYAAAFGFTTVALQRVATHEFHLSVDDFNKAIASAFVVHGIKVLWAPVVDTTLGKKSWYVIALALTIAGVMAQTMLPISVANLGLMIAVIMASQLGLTLMGMACEALLGHLPAGEKGTAAGWYQAGNYAGGGLGGGLALHLATSLPKLWMAGAALCLFMVPCAFALVGMDEPPKHARGLLTAVRGLLVDILGMVFERLDGVPTETAALLDTPRPLEGVGVLREVTNALHDVIVAGWRLVRLVFTGRVLVSIAGLTGLLICLSPIGSGGASNIFPSIADDWHALQVSVEAVNGWLGGIIGGVGAAFGGWVSDRMNRKYAYALSGALTAFAGLAMGVLPRIPATYDGGVLLYTFFNGMAYATFSAFVLETIGHGAVATKYNIFASLANLAIAYTGRIDSKAYARWHATGLFYTDTALTLAGITVLFLVVAVMKRLRPAGSADVAPPQAA